MPKSVLRSPIIYVGNTSVDVSNYVESIEFSVGVGNATVTAFGDTYEQVLPTQIKHWSVRLNFLQAYDTSETYAVMQPAFTTNASFPVFAKPTSAAVSGTNPAFNGNVVFDGDWNVMGGGVGEAHKTSVTLKGAGTLTFITSASA